MRITSHGQPPSKDLLTSRRVEIAYDSMERPEAVGYQEKNTSRSHPFVRTITIWYRNPPSRPRSPLPVLVAPSLVGVLEAH